MKGHKNHQHDEQNKESGMKHLFDFLANRTAFYLFDQDEKYSSAIERRDRQGVDYAQIDGE